MSISSARLLVIAGAVAILALASVLSAWAASARVELEFEDDGVIQTSFVDDGNIAVFNVDLENEGDAPAENLVIKIWQAAAHPAAMHAVNIQSGPEGMTCVVLSSLAARCNVPVLPANEEADIEVQLVTGDARGLPRPGRLRISIIGFSDNNDKNNNDKFDYLVVEDPT